MAVTPTMSCRSKLQLRPYPAELGTRMRMGNAGRQEAQRIPPRRLGTRACVTGVLMLLTAATNPPPWIFIVGLPEPGYKRVDGSIVRFTEFRGTRIDWGQCMDEDRIFEVVQSYMVKPWQFSTRISIPSGQEACIQAVVLDLEGDEMGRSAPVRVSTIGPRKNPMRPINLTLGF